MKKTVGLLGMALLALVACKKEGSIKQYDCTGVAPTYTTDVKAILDLNCALSGCHNSASHQEGIDLSSYAGAKAAAAGNNFLGSIQHVSGYTPMPDNMPQLADADIKTLSCWVQNGTPQ